MPCKLDGTGKVQWPIARIESPRFGASALDSREKIEKVQLMNPAILAIEMALGRRYFFLFVSL